MTPIVLKCLQENTTSEGLVEIQKGAVKCTMSLEDLLVKLPLERGSHPAVLGELGGKKFLWILDTGCTVPVVMDAQSALEAGLKKIEGMSAKMKGSGGGHAEGMWGRFQTLTLGDKVTLGPGTASIALNDYWTTFAGMFRKQLHIRMIGLPVLGAFSFVSFDKRSSEVTFSREGRYSPRAGAVAVPFTRANGSLWIEVEIGGRRVRALLDTGDSGSLFLSSSAMEKIPAESLDPSHRKPKHAMGVDGYWREEEGILREVALGGLPIKQVRYTTGSKHKESRLGWGLLSRGQWTLDFVRNRMWIEPSE